MSPHTHAHIHTGTRTHTFSSTSVTESPAQCELCRWGSLFNFILTFCFDRLNTVVNPGRLTGDTHLNFTTIIIIITTFFFFPSSVMHLSAGAVVFLWYPTSLLIVTSGPWHQQRRLISTLLNTLASLATTTMFTMVKVTFHLLPILMLTLCHRALFTQYIHRNSAAVFGRLATFALVSKLIFYLW